MNARSWRASERKRPATLGDHEGKTSRTTTMTMPVGRVDPPSTQDLDGPPLPLDPLPLLDLARGEWLAKTKKWGGGDDAVEERKGSADQRRGYRRALDPSGSGGGAQAAAVLGGARAERRASSRTRLQKADGRSGGGSFKSCIGKSFIGKPLAWIRRGAVAVERVDPTVAETTTSRASKSAVPVRQQRHVQYRTTRAGDAAHPQPRSAPEAVGVDLAVVADDHLLALQLAVHRLHLGLRRERPRQVAPVPHHQADALHQPTAPRVGVVVVEHPHLHRGRRPSDEHGAELAVGQDDVSRSCQVFFLATVGRRRLH
uniref:Uncharacterized protein n=1 Tax=Oryza punctata TaxID=4537 RepID=A0A0E0KED0_ORYPU